MIHSQSPFQTQEGLGTLKSGERYCDVHGIEFRVYSNYHALLSHQLAGKLLKTMQLPKSTGHGHMIAGKKENCSSGRQQTIVLQDDSRKKSKRQTFAEILDVKQGLSARLTQSVGC